MHALYIHTYIQIIQCKSHIYDVNTDSDNQCYANKELTADFRGGESLDL